MLRLIGQALLWLRSETLRLFFLAGVLLLLWGIFAPVGTIVWWLNEGAESLGLKRTPPKKLAGSGNRSTTNDKIDCYIVYLPGVGDFSANQLTLGEEFFLDRLVELHPNCVAVPDVFPYSAANESLGGRRVLAPLWQAIEQADGWLGNADVLIKIRNLWRFAISADDRYGPVYNRGIASAILDRMNAAHPIPAAVGQTSLPRRDQPLKLILIGTSGGVQVALGAAEYLEQWLRIQPIVVSVGGDFSGGNGFEAIQHLYHLQGQRDWIEDLSQFLFPTRWPWVARSPFNQARLAGKYTVLMSGPHTHDGREGYFGLRLVRSSGKAYVELTLETVNQLPIWSKSTPNSK